MNSYTLITFETRFVSFFLASFSSTSSRDSMDRWQSSAVGSTTTSPSPLPSKSSPKVFWDPMLSFLPTFSAASSVSFALCMLEPATWLGWA